MQPSLFSANLNKLQLDLPLSRTLLLNITNPHNNLLKKLNLNLSASTSPQYVLLSIKNALWLCVGQVSQANQAFDTESRDKYHESI